MKEHFKCQWVVVVKYFFFNWFSVICFSCELGCTDKPLPSDWYFQSVLQACHSTGATVEIIFHQDAPITLNWFNAWTGNHDVDESGANQLGFSFSPPNTYINIFFSFCLIIVNYQLKACLQLIVHTKDQQDDWMILLLNDNVFERSVPVCVGLFTVWDYLDNFYFYKRGQ